MEATLNIFVSKGGHVNPKDVKLEHIVAESKGSAVQCKLVSIVCNDV